MIVNLTPQIVSVFRGTPDGQIERFDLQPSGRTPQVGTIDGAAIDGVPTTHPVLTGMPDPMPGVHYVVTKVVVLAAHASGRATDDLLVPAGPVLDHEDRLVGYRSLQRA